MGYRKRYEDSYLDDEDEEFAGNDMTDGERLSEIIRKPDRKLDDVTKITKLTERLMKGAQMPAPVGEIALQGVKQAATAYMERGETETAVGLWSRLSDLAMVTGNKDLYYRAMDEIGSMGGEQE